MLKTGTYKKLEKKLAKATAKRKALPNTQAELIQTQKKYAYDIKQNQYDLDSFLKSIHYYQKNVRRNGRIETDYLPRSNASKATSDQQKYIDEMKSLIGDLTVKNEHLKKSTRYKHAIRLWDKLTYSEKKAYSELFRYKIMRSIKDIPKPKENNFNEPLAPHARIYPTDNSSTSVVYFFAQSESESNQSDVTQYTIDKDEPISDHSRNSEKTLTLQGYVVGKNSIGLQDSSLKSAEYYYQQLLKFKKNGTELTYLSNGSDNGKHSPHIYMHNLIISDLEKTLDQPTVDSFKVNITFQFVYRAIVLSSQRNINNKGKKDKKGKYAGAKHIRSKAGMSYWNLAKQYGTSVSQLKRWNGDELKVGSKIQVTEGHTITTSTTSKSKSIIYQRRR